MNLLGQCFRTFTGNCGSYKGPGWNILDVTDSENPVIVNRMVGMYILKMAE